MSVSKRMTVPQIVIGGEAISGYDDIIILMKSE